MMQDSVLLTVGVLAMANDEEILEQCMKLAREDVFSSSNPEWNPRWRMCSECDRVWYVGNSGEGYCCPYTDCPSNQKKEKEIQKLTEQKTRLENALSEMLSHCKLEHKEPDCLCKQIARQALQEK